MSYLYDYLLVVKRRMFGVSSGKMSRGPIIIAAFVLGMLAFIGYFYNKEYRNFETHIKYLVYIMGGISVLLFLIAMIKPKQRHR